MKKNKGKNSKKITDFFHAEQNEQKKEEKNEIYTNKTNEKNCLSLFEDGDSDLLSNNYEKNENTTKYKKEKIEEKNNINNNINIPSFFINLNSQSPRDEIRKLILLDFTNKKTLKLSKLNIEDKNFIDPHDYNPVFPFQYSKIINIDNMAYITGGKLNDELSKLNYNNELGENICYKLIINKEQNDIKIDKIPSTNFRHQSHSLLYSKRFNSIFLCSGHKQINCEYLNLGEKENKWKRLHPLQKPRENSLALLLNEKYIFLIGGKNEEGIINEDYDVIDFEIFISNKIQNYWKTFSFNNKNILERLGCGIIYSNNNVYIFGGFNKRDDQFYSWKINFEEDEEYDSIVFNKEKFDKLYKIKSIDTYDKINNYFKKEKNLNNLCYCGQQNFISNNGFLFNISLGGKLTIIPENIIKKSIQKLK